MDQAFSPLAVPHGLRASFIAGDGFVQCVRERGWSVADVRPIYTDLEVIRQSWLVCPNGAQYSDRTFYHLFGVISFRKLLRMAFARLPCPTTAFASIFPNLSERDIYLHDDVGVRRYYQHPVLHVVCHERSSQLTHQYNEARGLCCALSPP